METHPSPRLLLIPGYWLGAWAWDAVLKRLQASGVSATALDHPGVGGDPLASLDDLLAPAERHLSAADPVTLVAHSGAGAIASMLTDRHPDAVRRVVFVDSGPVADGQTPGAHLDGPAALAPPDAQAIRAMGPLVDGLTQEQIAEFATRGAAIPQATTVQPVALTNPQRLAIPATVICCSFDSQTVRSAASAGQPMFAPLNDLRTVDYLDLPTGHWPMWSRPDDLAAMLQDIIRGNP